MISPKQWPQRHLGSFRLNVGRQWELVEMGLGVEPEKYGEGVRLSALRSFLGPLS